VVVNITSVTIVLTVSDQNVLSIAADRKLLQESRMGTEHNFERSQRTAGETLQPKVNELPLNGRDFSTLLLLQRAR